LETASKSEILKRKKFKEFLLKGEAPFNYAEKLLREHKERVKAILQGENPPPYELEIQPSSDCNAYCDHCFGKKFEHTENRITTKKDADRIIREILGFEADGFKVDNIKFCGSTGEPLLNPYTLHMIEQFYKKKNILLYTNGIKIAENKNNRQFLETLSKPDVIYVSLDAGKTETLWNIKPGARRTGIKLEDILEGAIRIKGLSKNKIKINISYIITKKNYNEIIEATRKTADSGLDLIRFRIDMTDREVSAKHGKEINRLLDEAKKYERNGFKVIPIHSKEEIEEIDENYFGIRGTDAKCYTCKLWTCIGSDGNLYPCGHIVQKGTAFYGNVLEKSICEIWNSEQRKRVMENLPNERCKICSPSSKDRNFLMTFLSQIPEKERNEMINQEV
jgi:radical SAM protein with 4Fe4S-binding SPASM domain